MFDFLDLSAKVTAVQTKGHGYSFHLALSNSARELGLAPVTIGPSKESGSFVLPLLSYKSDKGSVGELLAFFSSYLNAVKLKKYIPRSYAQNQLLHVYEGGFREFLIVMWILKWRPDIKVVFNFSLIDPWIDVLNSSSLMTRRTLSGLKSLVRAGGLNFHAYSESEATKQLIWTKLACETATYPLFSSISFRGLGPRNRTTDICYFPMTESETLFCLDLNQMLSLSAPAPIKAKIVTKWGFELPSDLMERALNQGIKVVNKQLSDADYADLYLRTKLVMLPYFDDYYIYSSSGRALDAAVLGAYVFAPTGTAVGEMIATKHLGQTFDRNDVGSATAQIKKILENTSHQIDCASLTSTASLQILLDDISNTSIKVFAPSTVSVRDIFWASFAIFCSKPLHVLTKIAQILGVPQAARDYVRKSF